ncbi:MAG TPA: cupredoxin domain-containing protein [Gaiellales bacterium]|jgi:nitrite reductase (NO-forming)|nr:cupredoxin domain-containing protein [Gaiellales bacterium]
MQRTRITIALLGAALVVVAPATAATAHSVAKTTTITVKMTEFKFTLSKASAPKGTVVFKVANKGHVAHDFKINGKKTPMVAPGKSATLTGKFTKAGKFVYLCTVPGHAASGMKGTLTVK